MPAVDEHPHCHVSGVPGDLDAVDDVLDLIGTAPAIELEAGKPGVQPNHQQSVVLENRKGEVRMESPADGRAVTRNEHAGDIGFLDDAPDRKLLRYLSASRRGEAGDSEEEAGRSNDMASHATVLSGDA
jgi:hypothetical protein